MSNLKISLLLENKLSMDKNIWSNVVNYSDIPGFIDYNVYIQTSEISNDR
jgi:hypothetical protein